MIFVNLTSDASGVGVVGRNLLASLADLTDIERVEPGTTRAPLPGPLLERFYKPQPTIEATRHVAYIVFENDVEVQRSALRLRCRYDVLAATSRWCEQALRAAGLQSVTTIHHGVDGALFNPERARRRRQSDQFILFSGGKFEYRKAQDVVVRAFRVFSQRHANVALVAAWHNPWSTHAATMKASSELPFVRTAGESEEDGIRRWLADAGIDLRRVTLVPRVPHEAIAGIIGDTDVGLFPNRCEGATNLVLMEYMACGRAVIATNFAGHRDILTPDNSLRLQASRPLQVTRTGTQIACWCQPDLDEVLACLEKAYQDRDYLKMLGDRAAADMTQWTWRRAALELLRVLIA